MSTYIYRISKGDFRKDWEYYPNICVEADTDFEAMKKLFECLTQSCSPSELSIGIKLVNVKKENK